MSESMLALIFTFIVGGVGTVIGYLVRDKIRRQDDDIKKREEETIKAKAELKAEINLIWAKMEKMEEEMKEFKENYLDRFEKVNTNINAQSRTIMDAIHQLDKKIK